MHGHKLDAGLCIGMQPSMSSSTLSWGEGDGGGEALGRGRSRGIGALGEEAVSKASSNHPSRNCSITMAPLGLSCCHKV